MQQQHHVNSWVSNDINDNGNEEEDDEIRRSLFCANLDSRVDEGMLYELFLQAGPLDNVRIPEKRTFAFITYAHTCSPIYAMNLFQGISLYGKPLVIKYQGQTTAPPLPKRLLPPDWGIVDKNGRLEGKFKYDNSALRGSHFNPFVSESRAPLIGSTDNYRNNKHSQSPIRYSNQNNWDDSRDHSRRQRMGRERLHNNSSPYERRQDSSHERDRHYDDRRSRSHRR